VKARKVIRPANIITKLALHTLAFAFARVPSLKRRMRNTDGWIDFSLGICTQTGSVSQTIRFAGGRARVSGGVDGTADVIVMARDDAALKELSTAQPGDVLTMMLQNRITIEGNLAFLQLFTFYLSLLSGCRQNRKAETARVPDATSHTGDHREPGHAERLHRRRTQHLRADSGDDRNVIHLDDPYLSGLDLMDFPRLKLLLHRHRTSRPELCAERPRLLTEWHRIHGFEEKSPGVPWHPVLRQGLAFEHLMRNKRPVIADSQLLAGTTTTNPVCGVMVYPDALASSIWGELNTVHKRPLNPYDITEDTRETLHDILPFWIHRTFHECVNRERKRPLCLRISERFVAYVCSKALCVSHTVPDLKTILDRGTTGIIGDIEDRISEGNPDPDSRAVLEGMVHSLRGLEAYAGNLSTEARLLAARSTDPARVRELNHMARVCDRVPRMQAQTLDEAVQAVWTTWIGMHMENTNAGLSLGRLDQLLQPYFLSDMENIGTMEERTDYIHRTVELIGCLYLRIADHVPLSPEIGTILFGTSPSNQAITLGGVTPAGDDAVNDMTYIFLKVTEMLSLPDPNVNARISMDRNSETYVRRLCEVNFTTSATPSLHNDTAVFKALKQHGYPEEHIRDWSATGCVEPTISGRHNGHTGAILLNLVAALEMALNNGRHPLMQWDVGPRTGTVDEFATFEDFFEAFAAQVRFLITQAAELNDMYAEAHALLRPTPFLSSLMEGCIEKGLDMTRGGARYNTTGTANIGLADVTDSLMAIRKLVFEEHRISLEELKAALDTDFRNAPAIRALAQHRVPLFGSGSTEALAMANRVASMVHDAWASHRSFRGGRYTCGFWSMSQHTAYGNLSGALPSGRVSGKAFTPGITPEPHASRSYLDFISDVARLVPASMDNNMAFNVKLAPSPENSREETVGAMAGYVKTYCSLGGMQMQFNVVDSRVLKDAHVHPEDYRDLIVRISGYNAYFVTLTRQQQVELIERAEYGV